MNTPFHTNLSGRAPAALLRRMALHGLMALLSLTSFPAVAQKAIVRDGTIFRDGQAYARVQTSGTSSRPNFSFKTLKGEEFMMMTFDDVAGDYRVVFFPGEEQTRLPAGYGSLSVMGQEVVDNNFVESNAFNPAGLRRFMLAHPAAASPGASRARGTAPRSSGSSTSETVRKIDDELERAADDVSEAIINIGSAIERAFERDSTRRAQRRLQETTSRRVVIAGALSATATQLRKGSTLIATYDVKDQGKDDDESTVYTVRTPSGTMVARVTVPERSPRVATIVTNLDGLSSTLSLDGETQEEDAVDIGNWLLEQGYL